MTAGAKSAERVHKAMSSPNGFSASSFPVEPEVPMTFAPSTFPSCNDATPTPDETPLINSHSPALSRPCNTSMSYDTRNVIGRPAASSHDSEGGTAIASARSMSA